MYRKFAVRSFSSLMLCILLLAAKPLLHAQGTFAFTGSMTVPRSGASATLIIGCNCPADGKVLVVGGHIDSSGNAQSTADLYDPATGLFTPTGPMNVGRTGQSAALLPGGKVLVVGGIGFPGPADAEIYDPLLGTFSCAAGTDPASGYCNATVAHDGNAQFIRAVSLSSGKALITGLRTLNSQVTQVYVGAAIYDPLQASFLCINGTSSTSLVCNPSMNTEHVWGTATVLLNDTVLITGGDSGSGGITSAEIYDPAVGPNGTFVSTGGLLTGRDNHTATLLKTGEVLIAGGSATSGNLNSAEIYANGIFTAVGDMANSRWGHTSTLLNDGTVLVAGGCCLVLNAPLALAEIYDPISKIFSSTGQMNRARVTQTGTLLPDGQVLVAGGTVASGVEEATAELYNPRLAITSVTPTSGIQGQTIPNFTVSGNAFDSSATISFSGAGIAVNSYTSQTTTQIVASISVASNATIGARDVVVTNANGQQAHLSNGFTVLQNTDVVSLSTACINGLQVDINGAAIPGASVSYIAWAWGDDAATTGFFPQSHTYSSQGRYVVTVTAHYNDGSTASASESVTVAPGVVTNCVALTILAGQYGSVTYQASVGSGVVSPGSSATLQLDFADDLILTANPNAGFAFSLWSASANITGTNGSRITAGSASIVIVAAGSGTIGAIFTVSAESYLPVPTTVTVLANPAFLAELPSSSAGIVATVLDQSGNPIPGVEVTFTTSSGLLSKKVALTDPNGKTEGVALSPTLNSLSAVVAQITAAAGTIQSSTSVTFLPSGSTTTTWSSNPAFNVQQIAIQLNQFLSTPTNLYDDCIKFLLCSGTPINLGGLTAPAKVYFITPTGSLAQFDAALSDAFGIGQCTGSSQVNCVPSTYNPAAVILLELPVIQASNVLFNADLPLQLSLCAPSFAKTLFSDPNNPCIKTTPSGYAIVAFTISANSNKQLLGQDLLQAIAQTVTQFYKASPDGVRATLEADIQAILDEGDLTTSVITTDLESSSLKSYTLLDVNDLKKTVVSGFQIDGISGKFLTMLDAGPKVGSTAGADVLADAQLIMTALDLGVELLPSAIPALNDNQLFQWFETGLNVATTLVDPPAATIVPSFYDSSGSLVLGYDPPTGIVRYASPSGVLFPAGNGYLALLAENSSNPSNYSQVLNGIGANVPMPYNTQIRSYNRSQLIQGYGGMLSGGSSVTIPIQFASPAGTLVAQLHLVPVLSLQPAGDGVTIIARATLSDGSSTTATDAFLVLNGQQTPMTALDSSTFEITLNTNLSKPTPFMVYMSSPSVPGGIAGGTLGVPLGVHLRARVESVALDRDSDNCNISINIINRGANTANTVSLAAARFGNTPTVTVLPISLGDLLYDGSATVTLAFPTRERWEGEGTLLHISETYAGGTAEQVLRLKHHDPDDKEDGDCEPDDHGCTCADFRH